MNVLKKLKQFDKFGPRISIQYDNEDTHQTILGGIVSILLTGLGISYTVWRLILFGNRKREEYQQSSFYRQFEDIKAFDLNEFGSFSFEAYVNDPLFDNDDNPYGKIMLHRYTNMDGPNDTNPHLLDQARVSRDEIVPLVPC